MFTKQISQYMCSYLNLELELRTLLYDDFPSVSVNWEHGIKYITEIQENEINYTVINCVVNPQIMKTMLL